MSLLLDNGNAHIYFKVETSTISHHPLLPPTLPSRKKKKKIGQNCKVKHIFFFKLGNHGHLVLTGNLILNYMDH